MLQSVQDQSERWQPALERALSDALDVLIEPDSGDAFVESASHPSVLYRVSAESCTCTAGKQGQVCKHRACYLAQIGELPLPQSAGLEPAPKACMWCFGTGRGANDEHERMESCDMCYGTGARKDRKPAGNAVIVWRGSTPERPAAA